MLIIHMYQEANENSKSATKASSMKIQSCMSKFFFSVLSLIKEMCCRISGKLSMMTTGRWLKEQCLQVFMDMAVLVEAQEEILDNIESQVFKIYIMLIDER
ncbi:hypothetical protein B296_00038794 [Ensete ventricosum]|uniref:t-SNARE coiled-coil homology domain-containing protein n=1 Tax=Ensete ventricosum TaxID=4639 RepID=A0A426YLK8_ENSVE|nr:hypothetical protein B296_00038794 [Ensete ventricosum]